MSGLSAAGDDAHAGAGLAVTASAAAARSHGLIVVGGGIQGVMVALEAARRGHRPLLLEAGDFGGATTAASLRIVHGGLRYLQSADVRRFLESVNERRWFLRHFPDLVRPLPCLMPLYGVGLRRRSTLRPALRLNDLLSLHRNRGVPRGARIPPAGLLDRDGLLARAPGVCPRGLTGAAAWTDAQMTQPQRLVMELLRWAVSAGATALARVEALSLSLHGGAVRGVDAVDLRTGCTHHFEASGVVNAAGPWSGVLAEAFDPPGARDAEPHELVRPQLSFNVLLDAPPPAGDAAVAVHAGDAAAGAGDAVRPADAAAGAQFLVPHAGGPRPMTMAGTGQVPWTGATGVAGGAGPTPSEAQLGEFLDRLGRAHPPLAGVAVRRVFAGLLPAEAAGSAEPRHRPRWIEHDRHGGPGGLISVAGVKYTTARLVAEQTLRRLLGSGLHAVRTGTGRPPPAEGWAAARFEPTAALAAALPGLCEAEAVSCLRDVTRGRTGWGDDPEVEAEALDWLGGVLGLPVDFEAQRGDAGGRDPARTGPPPDRRAASTEPERAEGGPGRGAAAEEHAA
ncbi:FAD-dependent oxidoreductase [Phycisphaera mikurensis]|uniref:Putative glycerol-3-phosphate dehydrogenase n=1 Tax=Phycisphaera mikurensis (strain NBRC 102666 / KCTC 22515 / FYK2301M01) TaxID=1142394 RepID=I0IBD2_PHYMF|nr:FAD-dependent oxidoreductase [Phycisphaera mikurensis]MBB6443064.1 glycerol-3-phosphate dehydrogenase [Phycisphaera mikurensis]BAM02570.1 putative glycerol-3-phosphate dehydrogenase [Phycisphaera mikurensis NBRC 102666]